MKRTLKELEQKNLLLFNLLLRQQLYVDGVKTGFAVNYANQLRSLFKQFAEFFAHNRYSTLDQLTKIRLNEFLRQFQRAQVHFYSRYNEELIKALREFLAADLNISDQVIEHALGSSEAKHGSIFGPSVLGQTEESNDLLFNKIIDEPIPGTGLHVEDQIKQFAVFSNGRVLALIRQGYANGWTPQETAAQIVGTSENNFRDGLFNRLVAAQSAVLATVIQHIHANVEATIASSIMSKYRWVSVLDNRTTPICIARNGVIYIYGEGPLPPAHYNCRSTIVPDTGEDMFQIPASYYDWLVEQPSTFQDDLLGPARAAQLRSGVLAEKDFTSIGTIKPLTLQEFADKIRHILQGE